MSLVILGTPPGRSIYLGLDLKHWLLGPQFRGFGGLTPGFHLLVTSSSAELGHRSGSFFFIDAGEVVVLEWDQENEILKPSAQVADPYSHLLAPFSEESYHEWRALTGHIDAATLRRVLPQSRSKLYRFDSQFSCYLDEKMYEPSVGFHFAPIDFRRAPPGEVLTSFVRDKSSLIPSMAGLILGEFQSAYLIFTLGLNFGGFQHWRQILILMASSPSAISWHGELFNEFIGAFKAQLEAKHPGAELIDEAFSSTESLPMIRHLHDLYCNSVISNSPSLERAAKALRQVFRAKYGWDLADEPLDPDDEQPVIVDL